MEDCQDCEIDLESGESFLSLVGPDAQPYDNGDDGEIHFISVDAWVARVLECGITFDESGFDGVSPYAFGLVLEHYLARHVSMHSYTATVVGSRQRGRIAQWPPRPGTRSVV